MDYELIRALSSVLSAIAGGLIGFFSARIMWGFQLKRQQQNLARGLLIEIEAMEKMLTGWRNIMRAPPFPGPVRIDSPLYPEHGLYYEVQKDIFSFEVELAGSLFDFYSSLVQAEQMRKWHGPNDPAFAFMTDGVKGALEKVVDQIPTLRKQLRSRL